MTSNRIQVQRGSQNQGQRIQLEAGKRWEGAPNPAPISGGGANFQDGQPVFPWQPAQDLGLWPIKYPGYWASASCVCVILRGYSFGFWDRENELSGCAYAWPPGPPMKQHHFNFTCFYSICRVHLFYVLIHSANIKLFLSISCWTWSRAVTMRHHCFCTAYKEGWVECSPSDLLTFLPAFMSMGVVFCLNVHPVLWCLVSFCFIYFSILCNSPNILNRIVVCMSWPFRLEWGHVISSGQWPANVGSFASRLYIDHGFQTSKQEFWGREWWLILCLVPLVTIQSTTSCWPCFGEWEKLTTESVSLIQDPNPTDYTPYQRSSLAPAFSGLINGINSFTHSNSKLGSEHLLGVRYSSEDVQCEHSQ